MSWQLEVVLGVLVVAVILGVTAYVLGLGGNSRRTRQMGERLEGLVGSTVTVIIGTVEEQDLQALSRVRGVVVGVSDDKLVLRGSEGSDDGVWVWPVADGTVRIRLERILGIEGADGEMLFNA
jgi:hypothetical protein